MIIRKPYAILIRWFKRIHIVLMILSLYIYYKVLRVNGFVSEFVSLGTYNAAIEPITKYVSLFLLLVILIAFIGNLLLILLLKHKGKPWKLYLVPTVEYGIIFFVLIWARGFFNNFNGATPGMDIRLIRDVIFISMAGQFPIVFIYAMRILGLDLQKFNFKMDEEYLEISKEDREELQININIDPYVFLRLFNKTKRYLKYFYLEHKKICNLIAIVIAIILLKNLATFIFVTNKSYKQGDVYNANGYTIVINNSYYTDKDKKGEIIEENKAFVILDVSITNNWDSRELNLNNFHVVKGIDNYSQSSTTHSTEFDDLGKTVESIQEIKTGQTIRTILIYKVKKDIKVRTNKYVLFYQELYGTREVYLRKIKLDVKDISTIKAGKTYQLDDKIRIKTNKIDEVIAFDEPEVFEDEFEYTIQKCKSENKCALDQRILNPIEDKIYLKIPFSSREIDGKELVDISTNYGKIIYKDSKGKDNEIPFKSAISNTYFGKYLCISLDNQIYENNNDIKLKYIIRDNQYLITIPIENEDDEEIEGADEE